MRRDGPPRIAALILRLIVRGPRAEGALGDLEEEFRRRRAGRGDRVARAWYRRQALALTLAWWRPPAASARRAIRKRQNRTCIGGPREAVLAALCKDAGYALQALLARPGFTSIIVLTLALGIGANAAIFSFVDGILLKRLPFREPERLLFLHTATAEGERYGRFSHLELEALRADGDGFEGMAGFSVADRVLAVEGAEPLEIPYARVSDGFLRVLGTAPLLGRDFTVEEYAAGAGAVILSYEMWSSRFGRDQAILGRTVRLGSDPATVVGVMPPEFALPEGARLWRPLTIEQREDDDRELTLIARLAEAAGRERAAAQAAASLSTLSSEPGPRRTVWLEPARTALVRSARGPLRLLMLSAGLVLLITCIDISSLLVARGEERRLEVAVRAALGAGRGRIARGLLAESAILGLAGGAAGILLGYLALPGLLALSPPGTPRLGDVAFDLRVVGLMAVVALATGLAVGGLPALRISGTPARSCLSSYARAAGDRRVARLHGALVVGQLALATVLVFTAGLLTTTYVKMTSADLGFDSAGRLVVPLNLSHLTGQSGGAQRALLARVVAEAEALPGVLSADLVFQAPDRGRGLNLRLIEPEGLGDGSGGSVKPVTPGYFATAGIRVLRGRPFDASDGASGPAVAVVNESFVRAYLADREPVGTEFSRAALVADGRVAIRIVGVVEDIRPGPGEPELPLLYVPLDQFPLLGYTELLVRYDGPVAPTLAALRERIHAVDAAIPLNSAYTLEAALSRSVASPRFHMLVVLLFAGLAVAVTALGVYGVLSFAVTSRRREIGIRQAMGADASGVVRLVAGRGLRLTGIGVALGAIGALAMGRLAGGLLYGVGPFDPLILGGSVGLLVLVAATASLAPTLRAARVSPLEMMRFGDR